MLILPFLSSPSNSLSLVFPGPSFSQISFFPRNCCEARVPGTGTCLRHLLCVLCFQLDLQESVLCPSRPMALASPVLHTALYPGAFGVPSHPALGVDVMIHFVSQSAHRLLSNKNGCFFSSTKPLSFGVVCYSAIPSYYTC